MKQRVIQAEQQRFTAEFCRDSGDQLFDNDR